MPLNSRENLSSRISELGEGSLKDLLVDMNDSSWQWSRNKDSSTSRKRNVIVGGQTVDNSSASAGGGSGGSSSGGEGGGSSTSSDQIQSNWKEANPLAKAFIKNKPTLGSISSYDFSGDIGDIYFDGKEFVTKPSSYAVSETKRTVELSHCYSINLLDYSKLMLQMFYTPVSIKIENLKICYTGMNDGVVRVSIWTSGEAAIQYSGGIPRFNLLANAQLSAVRSVWSPSPSQSFGSTIPPGWYAVGVDAVGSSGRAMVAAYQPPSLMSPASDYPSPSQEISLSSGQELPDHFYPSVGNNASQLIWVEFIASTI